MTRIKLKTFSALICLMSFVVAACGGDDGQSAAALPTSTLAPLVSLTPRSTATPVSSRTPLPTFTMTPTESPIPPTPSDTPTPTEVPPIIGIVQSMQAVNLREGPDVNSSIIRAMNPGTGVEVLGQNAEGNWYNVRTDEGEEGWMSSRLIFIEATATPFPTMTPSPDETARALGTAVPTAVLGGDPVTPTPPRSVMTPTPVDAAPQVDADAPPEPTEPFLPIIGADTFNLTATALAAGSAPLLPPTRPPSTGTPRSPNDIATRDPSTQAPPATSSGGAAVRQNVDVFAMCDDPSFGAVAPDNLAAGSTIRVFWGWFMADPSYIDEHLDAVNYDIRVNDERLTDWRLYGIPVRQVGNSHAKYWFVPFGPLESGEYRITYRATWSRQISDGYEPFGPNTANPVEEGSCTFTVR